MEKKVFNPEILGAWKDLDPSGWQATVLDITSTFEGQIKTHGDRLMQAIAKLQLIDVQAIAHSLKSSCGIVGAEQAYAHLAALENLAEQKDSAQVVSMGAELSLIFDQAVNEVKKYRFQIQAA